MKRFFNIFLSFVIIALMIILPACSNNDNDDSNLNANEEYYLALGYHSITFDKYSTIIYDNTNNNLVIIDENKIMLPHNAKFSVSFNYESNPDFKLNNSNYINFNTGKILTGFTNGTKFYNTYNNLLTLKNNLSISATFENFKTLGVAILPVTNKNVNKLPNLSAAFDTLPTSHQDLLYYYSKDASYESFVNDTNQITASLLHNNKFELDICLETYFDTISVNAYLVLKDESNIYYFFEKPFEEDFINKPLVFDNLSNSISNIDKITLSLSYDLSTKDEY